MPRPVRKFIVRLRMWYADFRGHHGKKWDYEPSQNYMKKKKWNQVKQEALKKLSKILKSTLETKVKDNVATHGGEINFLSYEKGIVRLQMAGACSGCAMSKKTLHEGVERLLIHYVPEVIGLLGEDDEEAKHKGYTPYFPKEMNV